MENNQHFESIFLHLPLLETLHLSFISEHDLPENISFGQQFKSIYRLKCLQKFRLYCRCKNLTKLDLRSLEFPLPKLILFDLDLTSQGTYFKHTRLLLQQMVRVMPNLQYLGWKFMFEHYGITTDFKILLEFLPQFVNLKHLSLNCTIAPPIIINYCNSHQIILKDLGYNFC